MTVRGWQAMAIPNSFFNLDEAPERYGVDVIDIDIMKQAGLASKTELIKVLGNGELTAKLEVVANAFSKSAIEKIEALGGKAQII